MAESLLFSPEAPLLGELSSVCETERLYGDEPILEPKPLPLREVARRRRDGEGQGCWRESMSAAAASL